MSITVAEINALRQQTGAGMMDCKKALTEANGDMDEAIDFLRKKGQKVAELRAGRESNEGVALAITSEDKTSGIIISLSCETDFVAKNEAFVDFAKSIADIALTVDSIEELNESKFGDLTVAVRIVTGKQSLSHKIN